jgi:hypothetical protein
VHGKVLVNGKKVFIKCHLKAFTKNTLNSLVHLPLT